MSVRMSMVIVLAGCTAGFAADWPQFLGPHRDGVVTGQNLPEKFPEGGPKELWATPVGIGFGGASIEGGKVYVLDREEDARDVLRCLSLADGKEIWRSAYDFPGKLSYPGSRSTPTVDEHNVYTVGGFGHVRCFEKATGKEIWQLQFQEKFNSPVPNWGFAQSALLHGDHLIVAPMSDQAGLAALKKGTGEVVWQSENIGGNTYASPKLYTLGGVEQLVFITTTTVASIDPASGKTLWKFEGYKNNIPIPSPVQVDDKRLFITGGYGAGSVMVSVEKSGETWGVKELWRTPHGTQIHAAVLLGGHLYFNGNTNETLKGKGKEAPGLMCFDLDGKIKWQSNNDPSVDRGGFIVADGRAYLLNGQSGHLHLVALNPEAYKELDSAKVFETGGQNVNIWAPVSLSDGRLIVRDQQTLKCLDLGGNRQALAR